MPVTTTFAADDDLPKVPLPTLSASVDRFLEWCAPLLTPDEYARTESAALNVTIPENETCNPSPTARSAIIASPVKQWTTPDTAGPRSVRIASVSSSASRV